MTIRELITCHCDKCGDTFEVTTDSIGVNPLYYQTRDYEDAEKDFDKSLEWWSTPKYCWSCKEKYTPSKSARCMDDFVFTALKRCKK